MDDFTTLVNHYGSKNDNESKARAYYYIGKILEKQGKTQDAILHYEQVIKHSNDTFNEGNALYEIAKIKIYKKDFYEAFFTF